MKRIWSILLVLLLAVSLVSCNNTGDANSGSNSGSSKNAASGSSGEDTNSATSDDDVSDSASGSTNVSGKNSSVAASNNKTPSSGSGAKPSYTKKAKGSEYADGIMLPELSNAKISYMTNTTFEHIATESSSTSPTAIYHAMKIWEATYGSKVDVEVVPWDDSL